MINKDEILRELSALNETLDYTEAVYNLAIKYDASVDSIQKIGAKLPYFFYGCTHKSNGQRCGKLVKVTERKPGRARHLCEEHRELFGVPGITDIGRIYTQPVRDAFRELARSVTSYTSKTKREICLTLSDRYGISLHTIYSYVLNLTIKKNCEVHGEFEAEFIVPCPKCDNFKGSRSRLSNYEKMIYGYNSGDIEQPFYNPTKHLITKSHGRTINY